MVPHATLLAGRLSICRLLSAGVLVQAWDWQERARKLVWKLRKVAGGSERTLRIRAMSEAKHGAGG